MKKKIAIFYGTRPEYLKLKNIIKLIPKNKRDVFYIGQHDKLITNNLYTKKININKISSSKKRLNSILSQILSKINLNNYNALIIQGDTATTFAVAIAGFNLNKKIIYVESGLRSYDFENPFPEEGYRQLISRVATINFAPTNISKKNLKLEKTEGIKIITGNTGLDNLTKLKKKSKYKNKVLVTLHRRENIPTMSEWFTEINSIAKKYYNLKFIIPLHANPIIKKYKSLLSNITVMNHLNHKELISILLNCKFVITDSGGIQEEASFLNKKVIVCRKTTERPEGIKTGHLHLCKKPKLLKELVAKIDKNFKIKKKCPYGDGKSSLYIVKYLKRNKII